jgi:hypothetical protein
MYVGTPSHQIDRAWKELLWGRYFSISEEEAKDLWGADYHMYYDRANTGYSGGSVLLTLRSGKTNKTQLRYVPPATLPGKNYAPLQRRN